MPDGEVYVLFAGPSYYPNEGPNDLLGLPFSASDDAAALDVVKGRVEELASPYVAHNWWHLAAFTDGSSRTVARADLVQAGVWTLELPGGETSVAWFPARF